MRSVFAAPEFLSEATNTDRIADSPPAKICATLPAKS